MNPPILTEESLRDCLVIAQRIRICELESQIREAAESLRRAEGVIRTVLDGSGASLAEKLTAGAALAESQGILMRALIRPAALKPGDPVRDAPTGAPSPESVARRALVDAEQIQSAYVERQPLRLVKEQK